MDATDVEAYWNLKTTNDTGYSGDVGIVDIEQYTTLDTWGGWLGGGRVKVPGEDLTPTRWRGRSRTTGRTLLGRAGQRTKSWGSWWCRGWGEGRWWDVKGEHATRGAKGTCWGASAGSGCESTPSCHLGHTVAGPGGVPQATVAGTWTVHSVLSSNTTGRERYLRCSLLVEAGADNALQTQAVWLVNCLCKRRCLILHLDLGDRPSRRLYIFFLIFSFFFWKMKYIKTDEKS